MNPVETSYDAVTVLYSTSTVLISTDQHGVVRVNKKKVRLTKQEVHLLTYLAEGVGKVRTKLMMFLELYPLQKKAELKIIDVLACKLRKKLTAVNPAADMVIRTVWGRGYSVGLPTRTAVPIFEHPLLSSTMRWTPAQKSTVIDLLRSHRVSAAAVLDYYVDMSAEELIEWGCKYEEYGRAGLRTTRAKEYERGGYKLAA